MVGRSELEAAVAAATETFGKLRTDHPKLKAYLVLSHGGQQTGLTSNPLEILAACDEMVVAGTAKRDALRLLAEKMRMEAEKASESAVQRIAKELAGHQSTLRLAPQVQIELRFADLRYELVWALQKHPLIDQELTPRMKASIRIVLGTLENLSRLNQNETAHEHRQRG